MRIAMIGTGYVGLVSGACFAEFGHRRGLRRQGRGQDRAPAARARSRSSSRASTSWSRDNVEAGRLSFTTDLADAVGGADAVFIAVGTPSRRGDGHADLTYVFAAAEEIARRAHAATPWSSPSRPCRSAPAARSQRIIREPPARRRVRRRLQPRVPARGLGDRGLHAARPRRDRRRERARARGDARLYRPLYLIETPIVFTTLETAELIKYAANAFLATKITFINEIADLCETVGADVQDVAARHRPRRPHRPQVPASRPGLRRLVLPQGHAGAGCAPAQRGTTRRCASSRPSSRSTTRASGAWRDKIIDACGGAVAGKTIARARPHLQAQHRRHARRARRSTSCRRCRRPGATVARLRPRRHGARRASCCRTSTCAPGRLRGAARAPTRWS